MATNEVKQKLQKWERYSKTLEYSSVLMLYNFEKSVATI